VQTTQGVIADLSVETAQGDGRGSRVGEQRSHRGQLTIGLTQSTQCLDAGDTASGGIDERLKAGERLPVDHEASLVRSCFWINLVTG